MAGKYFHVYCLISRGEYSIFILKLSFDKKKNIIWHDAPVSEKQNNKFFSFISVVEFIFVKKHLIIFSKSHEIVTEILIWQKKLVKSFLMTFDIFFFIGEKPFKCLQCTRSFVSSGVLKAHIRTHTGLKAYKCLICDSTFTTNGSLKRHMSTHSEVRPFMCPYCQKTFKTSVNCKKHMKTHRYLDILISSM